MGRQNFVSTEAHNLTEVKEIEKSKKLASGRRKFLNTLQFRADLYVAELCKTMLV